MWIRRCDRCEGEDDIVLQSGVNDKICLCGECVVAILQAALDPIIGPYCDREEEIICGFCGISHEDVPQTLFLRVANVRKEICCWICASCIFAGVRGMGTLRVVRGKGA